MNLYKCHLIANECYIVGIKRAPTGIVVHSTGAENPRISRYVQPLTGQTQGITQSDEYMLSLLGKHPYSNHWNQFYAGGDRQACVNAFIGKMADGEVATVQTMPWDMEPWGCGSGTKGSYNRTHVQFEICEDGLNDQVYFSQVIEEAVDLCAFLCSEYGIPIQNIVSHHESYLAGYGNNHGDIDHWLKRFGMGMDDFRNKVSKKVEENKPMTNEEKARFEALEKTVGNLEKENKSLKQKLETASKELKQEIGKTDNSLKKSVDKIEKAIEPCVTSVNWDAHITGAMGGKEAVAMINDLKAHGDFAGKDKAHYALSEQMVRMMLIFYRMLKRLGVYK